MQGSLRVARWALFFCHGEARNFGPSHIHRNYLRKGQSANTEIMPLYARLSARASRRFFASRFCGAAWVLVTQRCVNSCTVQGIVYVIDPGRRASAVIAHAPSQRLPVEAYFKASATRARPCGRVATGHSAVRLYAEGRSFNTRHEFT